MGMQQSAKRRSARHLLAPSLTSACMSGGHGGALGGAHGAISARRRRGGGAYAASASLMAPRPSAASLMAEASPSVSRPDGTATSAAEKREKRRSVAKGPAT